MTKELDEMIRRLDKVSGSAEIFEKDSIVVPMACVKSIYFDIKKKL